MRRARKAVSWAEPLFTAAATIAIAAAVLLCAEGWMIFRLIPGEAVDERVYQAVRSGYILTAVLFAAVMLLSVVLFLHMKRRADILSDEKKEALLAYRRELSYRAAMGSDICAWAVLNVTRQIPLEIFAADQEEMARFRDAGFTEYFRKCAELTAEDGPAREYFAETTAERIEKGYEDGIKSYALEFIRRDMAGCRTWVSYESHLLTDPDSGDLIIFIYFRDIDEDKRQLEALQLAAEHDAMTGLLHHEATLESIECFLCREGKTGCHALYMVDLDNFKAINDSLGHQSGDMVIEETAAVISSLFRSTDVAGRIGGDEFMILMKNAADMQMVEKKAQELLEALRHMRIDVEISASVGVAVFQPGQTAAELYSQADKALYASKQGGKNRFTVVVGNK